MSEPTMWLAFVWPKNNKKAKLKRRMLLFTSGDMGLFMVFGIKRVKNLLMLKQR
jgi:hypothetical protein